MSSKYSNLLIRIAGLVITTLLLVQPWLVRFNFLDPFVISGWTQITASIIALAVSSIILAFYRPIKGYNSLTAVLSILFLAVGIALYSTNYNVSHRTSMIFIGLIACLGSLRLFRKSIDNYSIAAMVSLSGFFMAVYSIFQYCGYDFFLYLGKLTVVGTLTNPNHLGLFLCLTISITFGLFAEFYKKNIKHSLVFLLFFIVQVIAVLLLKKSGHMLCLAFMIFIWFWSKSFKYSGKISKKSPIIVGFLIAVVLFGCQWLMYKEITKYPWERVTKVPYNVKPFVSRLILWQMGLDIFKEHSLTGAGAGSIPYIMPLKRPPTASTLGLAIYNDDPHSIIISILAETGFLGLWGFCSLLVAVYGSFIRKNTKYEPIESESKCETPESEKSEDNNSENKEINSNNEGFYFPWKVLSIIVVIIYLALQAGFIPKEYTAVAVTMIIIFFGIICIDKNNAIKATNNDYYFLSKSTITAIFAFVFYSLFNTTVLPIIGFMVLLISLHFSLCLPDVRFKPRITGISLLFILLPVIYAFTTFVFDKAYNRELEYIVAGEVNQALGNMAEAEKNFLSAINTNPQCLKAYDGLAKSLEAQGKLDEAQDVYTQLDAMVPNIFKAKYKIANILLKKDKILEAHRFAVKNLEWAEDPQSYELLAAILFSEGRPKEGEEILKEGLIMIPANEEERVAADRLRLNLAVLAMRKGNYKLSKEYLDNIKSNVIAEHDVSIFTRASIYANEQQYDKALELYEQVLKHNPDEPRILNAIGYILTLTNKDLDRAQLLLETAYETIQKDEKASNSDYLEIAHSLAKLYLKKNINLKRAGELLKIVYEETPEEYKSLKEARLKDLNEFYNSFSNNQ